MAFDASPIGTIGDSLDPSRGLQQRYTLKDMANQSQLSDLQLSGAKRQAEDATKARSILAGQDISTPEGMLKAASALSRAGLSDPAMQLMREGQQAQTSATQMDESKLHLLEVSRDILGPAALNVLNAFKDPKQGPAMARAQYQQYVTQLSGSPLFPQQLKGQIQSQLPQDDAQAMQYLQSVVGGSQKARQILSEQLATRKEDTAEKTEAERERHDRELESQGRTKVDQTQQKIDIQRGKDGGLTEQTTDSLAEQAMSGDTSALQGLKPADKVRVRNRMTDLQQIRGLTGADQAAANAQFGGVKAGERTLGNRQANIDMAVQEVQNIEPILRKASVDFKRSGITDWNSLIQMADKRVSDPALYRFAQAAKSFANLYTRATVPGASSVTDREEAVKHLPTFVDNETFQSILDIMDQEMAAAKASPGQVREDMARAITNRQAPPSPGQTPNPGPPPAGGAQVGPGAPAAPSARPPTGPTAPPATQGAPTAAPAAARGAPAGHQPAPPGAIALLAQHPELRQQFLAKYGYLPQ